MVAKSKSRKILLLPGDGIGPEVIAEVRTENVDYIEYANKIWISPKYSGLSLKAFG